ncbi:MAG: hypothetical protein KF841_00980 [Phycisphaerae bacterium]|nr:hypothetical protein [Phycisphaerae bacterium]
MRWHRATARTLIVFGSLLAMSTTACDSIEANWDTSYWRRDRRVVRPSGTAQKSTPDAERDGEEVVAGRDGAASGDRAQPIEGESAGSDRIGDASNDQRQAAGARGLRPFYHLYLIADGSRAGEVDRNEASVSFKHVNPRTAGALLEMLYVSMGRSGSSEEIYLLFEQPDEFQRALAFANRLDVSSDPGGTSDPWREGIVSLVALIEQGALVDRTLIEVCERQFAEVVDGTSSPVELRWAAAIFAGKVAADYRYDYPGARAYYMKAIRFAKADSIEAMTVEWWRADTFRQEGATTDANEAYDDLLNAYTHLYPRSQIIQRSSAILRASRKRK